MEAQRIRGKGLRSVYLGGGGGGGLGAMSIKALWDFGTNQHKASGWGLQRVLAEGGAVSDHWEAQMQEERTPTHQNGYRPPQT